MSRGTYLFFALTETAMGHDNMIAIIVACVLTALTLLLYLKVILNQHEFVQKNTLTLRLAVLNVRTALIVPGFSVCYLISFVYPPSYIFMQLPEAFIQAYSLFCFLTLFVLYVGGPAKCLEIFQTTTRTFPSCLYKKLLNNNPRGFYQYIFWAHFQFIAIRPIVVAISVIAACFQQWYISDIISFIATLMVAYAVIALLKAYHVLFEHCHGLNAMTKVTVIKGTIGLVLGEGFIEELLFAFNIIDTDEQLNSVRLYCFIVIVELFLIAILLERVFSTEIKVGKALNPEFQPHIVINETTDGVQRVSRCEFVRCVFDVMDIFSPVIIPREPVLAPTETDMTLSATIASRSSGVTELTKTKSNVGLSSTSTSSASNSSSGSALGTGTNVRPNPRFSTHQANNSNSSKSNNNQMESGGEFL